MKVSQKVVFTMTVQGSYRLDRGVPPSEASFIACSLSRVSCCSLGERGEERAYRLLGNGERMSLAVSNRAPMPR